MDMFDSLLSIDKSLVSWIIQTSPENPNDTSEEQSMQQVLAERGDVEKALNGLIAFRLKLAAAALVNDTQTMNQLADQMSKVDKDIANVQTVVTIASQAVAIAVKTITALAG
jgi:hypothetical protein